MGKIKALIPADDVCALCQAGPVVRDVLRRLRELVPKYGSQNIVYFDETGFEQWVSREYGWALRGKKIFGEVIGKYHKRTNLIMAQRGKEWLAPLLFEGSCTAQTVTMWIEKCLLKELGQPSVIVMDNAPIHNKKAISEILRKAGHILLPLPPYSPDFNPIEQTFGVLKRRRQFAYINENIDQLFLSES